MSSRRQSDESWDCATATWCCIDAFSKLPSPPPPDVLCNIAGLLWHCMVFYVEGTIPQLHLEVIAPIIRQVQGSNQFNEGIELLSTLPHLQRLLIPCCFCLTDAGVSHLRHATQLQWLDLTMDGEVGDDGVASLKELKHLAHLNLSYCSRITDAALGFVAEIASLDTLNVARCPKLSDEGIAKLSQLQSLTSLNISWCSSISDSGIIQGLAPLPKLRILTRNFCGRITSAGLAHLHLLEEKS